MHFTLRFSLERDKSEAKAKRKRSESEAKAKRKRSESEAKAISHMKFLCRTVFYTTSADKSYESCDFEDYVA